MELTLYIFGAFLVGGAIGWFALQKVLKGQEATAKERAMLIVKEAENEAEIMKKNKLLEAKETFLGMKAEHEKEINTKNIAASQRENTLKQKEQSLNQKLENSQRKEQELDNQKVNLNKQTELLEKKKEDIEQQHQQQVKVLEKISGLSQEEAKSQLIAALTDEARTKAMSEIKDIVEDAKMTAAKEAKKIVISTIQRTATESAIENTVSVFNIESDEVKGRIIGREGRNIRALEAATGIEIIVDDTPEAIILSGFDPIRREIQRFKQ